MSDRDRNDDPHNSFTDTTVPIGAGPDGTITSFPASELPAYLESLRQQEQATTYAMEQSEGGFPDEDDKALRAEYELYAAGEPDTDDGDEATA